MAEPRPPAPSDPTVAAAVAPPCDVTLVVPVGGEAAGWNRCAASLAALDPPPRQVVVVLDGDDPDHRETLGRSGLDADVVALQGPRGPAEARNRGAREARGAVLLFVDSDVEVPPDLVARVDRLLRERRDLAAVIGSYDDAPSHPALVSRYRNLLHHFVHQHSRRDASTFWGACGAVRRSVFEEVGGFDERFAQPSVEDIELGMRLRRSGHRIALEPSLMVKHLKRWTVPGMLHTDLWRRAVPWTELMLASGALLDDLNVRRGQRWSVAAAGLLPLALAATVLSPWALIAAAALLLLLLACNLELARFFARRGLLLLVVSAFWYWVYLLVCGVGYAIGWWRVRSGRARAPAGSAAGG